MQNSHILAFAFLMILKTQFAMAQSKLEAYNIDKAGAYYLAIPKTLQVELTRDGSNRLPSCDSLTKDLEPMLESIETCGSPESKGDEFCKYTTRIVREKVLGIKSQITGRREADAQQLWTIQVTLAKPSALDFTTLAGELAATDEQLPRPSALSASLRHAEINRTKSKLLNLLAKLDDPELAQIQVREDASTNALSISTTSRAVSCELLAGNLKLQIESDVKGSFEIPSDQNRMTKLWGMKKVLEPLLTWKPKQERYKFITAGYRIAKLEDLDREDELEKTVLADSELLVDFGAPEFKLIDYKNQYALGQRLPQTKVESRVTINQVWDLR